MGAKKKTLSPLQKKVKGPGMVVKGLNGVRFIHSTVIELSCEDTVLGKGKWPWKCKIV